MSRPSETETITQFPGIRWGVLSAFVLSTAAATAGALTLIHTTFRPVPAAPALRTYEGVELTVAYPAEPATVAEVLKRYSPPWQARTGAKLRFVPYDALKGPESTGAAVWVIPPAELPRWAAAGKLQPFPESVTFRDHPYGWHNILFDHRRFLLVWDRPAPYALPLLGDARLLFYREDLFRDPVARAEYRKTHAEELEPPHTWQQYLAVAQFFNNRPRPGGGQAGPSLPPLPQADEELDREFFQTAVAFAHRAYSEDDPNLRGQKGAFEAAMFSCHYDLENGTPNLATPGFVGALKLLQQLQKCRPPGAAPEPAASFADGSAVMCLAGPEWVARFQANPAVRGQFGFRRMPASDVVYGPDGEEEVPEGNYIPYVGAGGWVGVVAQGAARPEAAFALLEELSGPRVSRDVVIEPAWGGGAYRRPHLDSLTGWQAFGLDTPRTQALLEVLRDSLVHHQTINPVLRLRLPDQRRYQEALVPEVRAALQGKDASQALKAAAAAWQKLDQAKDRRQREAEYRLSIGLQPER